MLSAKVDKKVVLAIIVSSLGFFVDLYDIMALSAVGKESFKDLNVPSENSTDVLTQMLNLQMAGMILGGFIWGSIGDKYGRLKVLFGSIIIYSVFTLLNAFVENTTQYSICRFLAGIGLAGELGAGITLVSEQMDRKNRGYGPAIIAGFGMFGAVSAALVNKMFDWKTTYIVGGVLGLLLLLLRVGVVESGIFKVVQHSNIEKGSFKTIFRNKKYLLAFISILFIGIPGWFANGVLISLSAKVVPSLNENFADKFSVNNIIIYFFIALAIGDIIGGFLSQKLKSRKKTILYFLIFNLLMYLAYFTIGKTSLIALYLCYAGLGLSVGFVIQLFTLAAEQFGTNVRNLVTVSGLNLIRGWVIPLTLFFNWITKDFKVAPINLAVIMGIFFAITSIIVLQNLDEDYGNDLDFVSD